MRDIKFRGKNKTGKWIYGTGIVSVKHNTYETKNIEIIQEVNYDELDYFLPSYDSEEVRTETIGQYTGLKDKNGVEIYEGDIVRIYGNDIEDWIVSYEYGKFVGTFDNVCEDLYELIDMCEVIGNIHDNPELLEV